MSSRHFLVPGFSPATSSSSHALPITKRKLLGCACVIACLVPWLSPASALAQAASDIEVVDEPSEGTTTSTPGSSMDSEGADPVDTETSEQGPYSPGAAKENEAGAEEDAPDLLSTEKPFEVSGDLFFGFGEASLPGPTALRAPSATSISIVANAWYTVQPNLRLGLSLPWATASFEDTPNAIDESANALGNPMLRLEYRLQASRVLIPLRFGVGIPVGQGEPDITSTDTPKRAQAQVHAITDAARGLREGEYYAVGRMPVTLSAGAQYQKSAFHAEAFQTFLVMPKIRGDINQADANPGGTYSINTLALRSVTEAQAGYWVIPEAGLALAGWLAYDAIEAIEFEANTDVTPASRLHGVIEPKLQGRLSGVDLGLGYVLPLGGSLSDGDISGLRLSAKAHF